MSPTLKEGEFGLIQWSRKLVNIAILVAICVALFLGIRVLVSTLHRSSKPKSAVIYGTSGVIFDTTRVSHGRVAEGELVESTFHYTNRSATPIRIGTITTSCGCMSTISQFKEIQPNQSGEVKLSVTTHGLHAPMQLYNRAVVEFDYPKGITETLEVAFETVPWLTAAVRKAQDQSAGADSRVSIEVLLKRGILSAGRFREVVLEKMCQGTAHEDARNTNLLLTRLIIPKEDFRRGELIANVNYVNDRKESCSLAVRLPDDLVPSSIVVPASTFGVVSAAADTTTISNSSRRTFEVAPDTVARIVSAEFEKPCDLIWRIVAIDEKRVSVELSSSSSFANKRGLVTSMLRVRCRTGNSQEGDVYAKVPVHIFVK